MSDPAIFKTEEEMIEAWGKAAAAKLRADNVSPDDSKAARETLCACVGGERLYLYWKRWKSQQAVEQLAFF